MSTQTQAIFDKMVTRMLKQGKRSETNEGSCRYRCGDLCCAAGALIDDKHYSEAFEGKNVSDHRVVIAIALSLGVANLEYHQLKVIELCQKAHDQWDPSRWAERFEQIAKDYNLKMPEVVA